MGKFKPTSDLAVRKSKSETLPEAVIDPFLASLFANSAGPVKVSEKYHPTPQISTKNAANTVNESSLPVVESSAPESSDIEEEEPEAPPRKRRRVKENDDLEGRYLSKLAGEEEKEEQAQLESRKSNKSDHEQARSSSALTAEEDAESLSGESSASNDLLDLSSDENDDGIKATASFPLHESLAASDSRSDQNRRTVFLSNVCTSAIKSKTARKALISHLKSVLLAGEKIESMRFRSTAFVADAGPKRAAFAKKELMDQTMRSTNAYVVFSSEAAARRAAAGVNGTVVLDRHVHADSLANPIKTDNKRCVFIGNLPFVDEETAAQDSDEETGDGKKNRRPKAKAPADAEEGLWRAFSKCGKVESVRVVRDKATRIGKGFAYVQFEDGNGVEKALLYDGKKFPPQLPRILRVSRAKGVKRKDVRVKSGLRGREMQKSRDSRRIRDLPSGKGKLDGVIFEGYRASDSKGKDQLKVKTKSRGKKDGGKPANRSSKRGAAFKASGGKKKRDGGR